MHRHILEICRLGTSSFHPSLRSLVLAGVGGCVGPPGICLLGSEIIGWTERARRSPALCSTVACIITWLPR